MHTGGREEGPTSPACAPVSAPEDCLAGGGDMGVRMRTFDWSATPLGAVARWPQSLQTAVSICLASRFPIQRRLQRHPGSQAPLGARPRRA
jgi:hypothetical protein